METAEGYGIASPAMGMRVGDPGVWPTPVWWLMGQWRLSLIMLSADNAPCSARRRFRDLPRRYGIAIWFRSTHQTRCPNASRYPRHEGLAGAVFSVTTGSRDAQGEERSG